MPANRGVVQYRRGGSMGASENTYRLYSCARCAKQVRICRNCDRGNRYCAQECARIRRRESLRRACRRYQQSYRGACKHAARQRAWRERRAQKVTHQGSLGAGGALILAPIPIAIEATDADTKSSQPHAAGLEIRHPPWRASRLGHHLALEPRCCFCGAVLAPFARLGWLRQRN
jgi:hypothetical protein